MIRRFALVLLPALFAASLFAQDRAPSAVFEATQCLATGKYAWLDLQGAKDKELQLAYHADNKTYGGAHYLYVIVFNDTKRDSGKVFDIRVKEHHTYSIENNAKFAITPDGIKFTEPPLGGNWTENQLTGTVKQILKHRKWYEAQVKALLHPSSSLRCETAVEDVVNPAPKATQQTN